MTQKEFRKFLIELGFVKSNVGQDVLFGDIFTNTWVHFSLDGDEELTEYIFRYMATGEIVDVGDFVKKSIEARDLKEDFNRAVAVIGNEW